MMPNINTAIVLICSYISVQQFSVNGIALENSIDSLDDHFNLMLDSPYSTTANYNSSNLLGSPNLFDSVSSLWKGKSNKPVSKMCNLNTAQLCEYYGYKSEEFTVTTTDGYILTVFRCYGTITKKQPVLLIHGMMDSSDTWVMNPGNRSLAYNYIERGYDVYLMNCRGDRYSEKHTKLNSRQSAFWNFTWQEMARYDLPETIAVILKRTGSSTIQCAGHSQGGTIILALLAMQPQYNQIITHAGLFASFTFLNNVGFPISTVLKKFYRFDYHRYRQFVPHGFLSKITAHTICKVFKGRLCNLLLNFVLGPSMDKLDGDMIPVYFCHFPAGCSSKQLWHFGQEMHCKYFGEAADIKPPGCPKPAPSFDLSKITTAISMFYSPTDPHTHPLDVGMFQKSALNANLVTKELDEFSHLDYVWGKRAAEEVYDPMIERATQFESN